MTGGGGAARRRRVLRPAAAWAGLVLAGLVTTAPQGWAQGRTQGVQRPPAASFPTAMRLTPSARESLRRWLCPNGGAPAPGAPGRCDSLRQEARNATASPAGDAEGWFRDLPPARGGQRACPEGTRSVPARDRPETVRCMPG